MKKNIIYEARLNRNIKKFSYGSNRLYKKGTIIWSCPEKTFKKLTKSNIDDHTGLCICEGHGSYQYFDLEKDIEFFKVETVVRKKESLVKLKN